MRNPIGPVVDISPDTLIRTEHGIETWAAVQARCLEHNLWAIRWENKNKTPHGISFHPSYSHAHDFISKELLISRGRHSAVTAPKLIVVSEWLYEWVQEFGNFWAEFNDFDEAATYNGPSLN